MRIQSGFNIDRIGTVSMVVTEATGSLNVIPTLTTGTYCHEDISAVMGSGLYTDFASALQSELDTASADTGNGWTYTVSYSTSTLRYTVSAAEGNIQLTFAGTGGLNMREILGFTSNKASAASHTSDMRPFYSLTSALECRSRVTRDHEMGGLISGSIAADGSEYSIAPRILPEMYDWSNEFEYLPSSSIAGDGTAVFASDATSDVPWSYQAFWQHVRGAEPFLVVDPDESSVHKLRPQHAHFSPARRQTDWDMWDLEFRTYLRGRL